GRPCFSRLGGSVPFDPLADRFRSILRADRFRDGGYPQSRPMNWAHGRILVRTESWLAGRGPRRRLAQLRELTTTP
ncbi:hypothetical protein, partial [Streptomyces sparsogenes]|uniref:hypothetical protein n=1 Tax=Streptomyces sparsogenes TaxID=67365 RepID=UPI001B802798